MKQKLLDLLEGSPVSPKTHPVLVSLLSMAAQGARAPGAGAAIRKQLARDWRKVAEGFRRCVAAGITDERLCKSMPFPGLQFSEARGWRITDAVPLRFRDLIASALEAVASETPAALEGQVIASVDGLRDARRRNGMPALESAIASPGRVEGRELPGGRLVISRDLFGRRVYSLVEWDQFGRLQALTHERSRLLALKFHEANPSKS